MAICSVEIEDGDTKQLTIIGAFTTEPFPLAIARGGELKVKDEGGHSWTFKYTVKSSSKRIISGGHWVRFVHGVGVGAKISFERNTDGWGPEADYKIEVIS